MELPYKPCIGHLQDEAGNKCALGYLHSLLHVDVATGLKTTLWNALMHKDGISERTHRAAQFIALYNDEGKFEEAFRMLPNLIKQDIGSFRYVYGNQTIARVLGNLEAYISEWDAPPVATKELVCVR